MADGGALSARAAVPARESSRDRRRNFGAHASTHAHSAEARSHTSYSSPAARAAVPRWRLWAVFARAARARTGVENAARRLKALTAGVMAGAECKRWCSFAVKQRWITAAAAASRPRAEVNVLRPTTTATLVSAHGLQLASAEIEPAAISRRRPPCVTPRTCVAAAGVPRVCIEARAAPRSAGVFSWVPQAFANLPAWLRAWAAKSPLSPSRNLYHGVVGTRVDEQRRSLAPKSQCCSARASSAAPRTLQVPSDLTKEKGTLIH